MPEWISVKERMPEFPVSRRWTHSGSDSRPVCMVFESEAVIASDGELVFQAQAKLRVPLGNMFSAFSNEPPHSHQAISCPLMWNAGEADFSGVTHWMPLPDPPKESA